MLQIPNLSSLSSIYAYSLPSAQFHFYSQEQKEEMYSETGLAFGFMQSSPPPQTQQYEDLFKPYKLSDDNLIEASEYDFGEESDLFKAPEPIIEEPMLTVDPLSQELVELGDIGSLQSDQQLMDKAFYECEQDLMVKSAMESPLSEVLNVKNISLVAKPDNSVAVVSDVVSVSKSVSYGNLSSMDMGQQESAVIQSFPEFPLMDYGMRRAFSESDIQTMGAKNVGLVHSHSHLSCTFEDRKEKLSRYRNKKSRRNFGRKIKYACRKALADSQPRIRGRFAKTEEMQK